MTADAARSDLLRSYRFRQERERSWRELDELIQRAERRGMAALSAEERQRLPLLHRAALSSLSVARSILLDQAVIAYLEALAARSHFLIYAPPRRLLPLLGGLIAYGFPAAVRSLAGPILIATAALVVGILAGWGMTSRDMELFHGFVPEAMAQGRNPGASTAFLRDVLYEPPVSILDGLSAFAIFLFQNNAGVGILTFGLGFAFGLPAIVLLFWNGASMGAMFALHDARGLGLEFGAWLTVHGTTELLAIVLCGGAGLELARAMLFPRPGEERLASIAAGGRRAGRVVLGAVLMLVVAAALEAYARQTVTDDGARLLIGVGFGVLWTLYLGFAGRGRPP